MATSPKQKAKAPAPTAPAAVGSQVPPNRFPLFKGATRVATVPGGVPTRAFAGLVFLTATAASFIPIWGWFLFPILYPIMAILSRNDDRAFWIWELWVKTKLFARNKGYWGAISLTPTPYSKRRPWVRWLGVHDR